MLRRGPCGGDDGARSERRRETPQGSAAREVRTRRYVRPAQSASIRGVDREARPRHLERSDQRRFGRGSASSLRKPLGPVPWTIDRRGQHVRASADDRRRRGHASGPRFWCAPPVPRSPRAPDLGRRRHDGTTRLVRARVGRRRQQLGPAVTLGFGCSSPRDCGPVLAGSAAR